MTKNIVKSIRIARKISQQTLGDLIGVNQKRIAKIESNPDSVNFGQIKEILKAMAASIMVIEEPEWENPMTIGNSFIYILQHKTSPIIKIGKADNVSLRASQIGSIDPSRSFSVSVANRAVFDLEKILHKTFKAWKLTPSDAITHGANIDGSTEWFRDECKARLISFLESNQDLYPCDITTLNKGCPHCCSSIDSWYGMGWAIYICGSVETKDGIVFSDVCKGSSKSLNHNK